MAEKIEFKVEGLVEIKDMLNALPTKLKTRVMKPALKAGANVMMKQARLEAPRAEHAIERKGGAITTPGTLRRAIKAAVMKSREWYWKGAVYIQHGKAVSGKRKGSLVANDAFYFWMVEKGHKIVRKKRIVGHVPEHPYLVPAFEKTWRKAVDTVEGIVKANMDKLVKK